jgi:hypothetical protein
VRVYTASYGAWRPEHGVPVVASLTVPKWLPEASSWPRYWPVTPRWAYFYSSAEEYERAFLAQLERYGARRIARELAQIARQQDAESLALCCWESSPDRCHRGLFAAWWLVTVGERIEEVPEIGVSK